MKCVFKANVRKSGIQALAAYLPCVNATSDVMQLFNILKARCVDASVLVRKQSAESLSSLLNEMKENL